MRSRVVPAFALLVGVFVALTVVLSGCSAQASKDTTQSGGQSESTATSESPFPGEEPLYTPAYKPNGDEVAVIKTTKGTIKVKLFGKEAPIHVGNFVELARKGFYDNIKFHRYIAGFVIQGGDPQTKDMTPEEVVKLAADDYGPLGTGGPGYTIKGEFDPAVNPHKHTKGALAMARAGSPDSAGSQFYFALEPLARLDGSYTVFGEVTEGLEVMEQLRIGDVIESVAIENAAE